MLVSSRTLAWLNWATGTLGFAGLALSLLLSFVVTRRTLRGVGEVADAARQVARGDLDLQIDKSLDVGALQGSIVLWQLVALIQ